MSLTGLAFSDYTEGSILAWLKGTAMPTAPATCYLGLLTAIGGTVDQGTSGAPNDPTEMTTTANVATGYAAYARQAISWSAVASASGAPVSDATGQQIQNSAQITFPANGNTSQGVTVVGLAIYDASTAGHCLGYVSVTSVTVPSGVSYQINANNLTWACD